MTKYKILVNIWN